jgi:preprotein translocase SecE subunit
MKSIIKFLSEARTELLKVSWPTRKVALNLTLTVIGVSLAFAVYIAGVDFVLTEGIKWISVQSGQQTSTGTPVTAPPINIGDIETTPVN